MANYKLKTQIQRGKFKGKKVSELIKDENGKQYLLFLHNSKKYNVRLTGEVINCL